MRQESDFLGSKDLPDTAYWGVHAARAVENFPITGHSVAQMPHLIRAFAYVKKAAAAANLSLGTITAQQAQAIAQACDDVATGMLDAHFVVDVLQGGAGTSTNMNANEVIANRALEIIGQPKGAYDVIHPNDHVNRSQSSNDVYPSAMHIAASLMIEQKVLPALDRLYRQCQVFVLPAIVDSTGDTEMLGMVSLEAMRYGKPVVATAVGGISDIVVNDETGLLVGQRDPAALAAALDRLLEDPALGGRLGRSGYEFARQRFAWPAVLDQTLALYGMAPPAR